MTNTARSRDYEFVPRIINPIKVNRAILFAADAQVRQSKSALQEKMPWVRLETLYDPFSLTALASEEASVFLFDDTSLAIADAGKIRSQNANAVLVLLTFQPFIQCAPPGPARDKYPYTAKADLIFAVNRKEFTPAAIIPSAVRAAEDRLNVEKSTSVRRFIFHLVDDEPRWFSEFLPVLYEIIGQRADVMISRTYEESLEFLFGVTEESRVSQKGRLSRGRGDDVVCLITDIFFPRGGDLQSDAGRDLIRLLNTHYPRIPVIIASKAKEAHELSHLGFILPKGDPGSLEKLKDHILNFTGLGDFIIYGRDGRELRRARDIHGICRILLEAEKETALGRRLREILESYGEKDKFSTWLYMHSYRELGDRLRPRHGRGHQLVTVLKRNFQTEMARMARTPLLIGDARVSSLTDLLASLRKLPPETFQPYSDNDILSSWLDRRGYTGLAEELRPIHGSGEKLRQTVVEVVTRWIETYRRQGHPL
jgi:hypothetical protein